MSFWKRITRRRTVRPQPIPADRTPSVGGLVSSEYTGQTFMGKRVVRIGDPDRWREEDAMRDRAQSALDPADESYALTVVELLGRYADLYDSDPRAADAIGSELRSVGRQLCDDGGSNRMKLIAHRVAALGHVNPYAKVRTMESFWNGICGWQV